MEALQVERKGAGISGRQMEAAKPQPRAPLCCAPSAKLIHRVQAPDTMVFPAGKHSSHLSSVGNDLFTVVCGGQQVDLCEVFKSAIFSDKVEKLFLKQL